MENATKKIVNVVIMDKRETSRKSVNMEKEAFMKTLETLMQDLNVIKFCTDAHSQISSLFNKDKGLYKDSGIKHTLTWRLLPWPVGGNKELIPKGSIAHCKLTELIIDERWSKTIPKYLTFRSTAPLESFHAHILMYAPKRNSFIPPVYAVRTQLAALDYNEHCSRPYYVKADGKYSYHKMYNKKSGGHCLYIRREKKTYDYIKDLQHAILRTKLDQLAEGRGMPRKRTMRSDNPRRLGPLSGVPAPSTEELLESQRSRGRGEPLPQ